MEIYVNKISREWEIIDENLPGAPNSLNEALTTLGDFWKKLQKNFN